MSNHYPSSPLKMEGHSFRSGYMEALAIPSTFFTFGLKDGKPHFAGEISEIQHAGHRLNHQMYTDAADVGFAMRSVKTRALLVFSFHHEELDPEDGSLRAYHYRITEASARREPQMADCRVTVYND